MPESPERKAYRRAWAKAAYAKNPDKFREYARIQHAKHLDTKKAKSAAYRELNKDKLREYNKAWREANKERIRRNNSGRIGFTPGLFDELLDIQNGLCAICEVQLSTIPSKHVHADHCHSSGAARGVLCHACNAAIGLLAEDPARMLRAIAYLEHPTMKRRRP